MHRLNNICIPTIKQEKDLLLQNFILWENTCFDIKYNKPKLNLIISINKGLDQEYQNEVQNVFAICPNLGYIFKKIIFYDCNLSTEEDLYISKPEKGKKYPKGFKTGPNNQFFKTMRYLHRFLGATLYVETDCTIVNNTFIEEINETIAVHPDFYTIGSMYMGKGKLHENIENHINGNAIYNTGNKDFLMFLNQIWEPYTISIAANFPHIAYDITIEYAKSKNLFSEEILKLTEEKFISHDLIQNHGGPKDIDGKGSSIESILQNKKTAIVHGRHLTGQFVQLMSQDTDDIDDTYTRPILIYQMGKVGSSHLYNSLIETYPNREIFHIHCLGEEELQRYKQHLVESNLLNNGHERILNDSMDCVRLVSSDNNFDVITMTRDHIARTVSYFFENMGSYLYNSNTNVPLFSFVDWNQQRIKRAIENSGIDKQNWTKCQQVIEQVDKKVFKNFGDLDSFILKVSNNDIFFTQTYKRLFYKHGYNKNILPHLLDIFYNSLDNSLETLRWFDTEFNINLGINIYNFLFDPQVGFINQKNGKTNYTIMQSELDNKLKFQHLRKTHPKLKFSKTGANISAKKHYSDLYIQFKEEVQFENEYLDKIYNSKYMRYFYSDHQINEFYNKWKNKITA